MAAALHKQVAVPERLRTPEGEHRPAALVALRTPAEHYIAVEQQRPVPVHMRVERCRLAAAARPVRLRKGPAEGRRVRSGRLRARWELVAMLRL